MQPHRAERRLYTDVTAAGVRGKVKWAMRWAAKAGESKLDWSITGGYRAHAWRCPNGVKLESVHTRAELETIELHESVQAVEFLGNAALATVMVTRTEGSELYVQPEFRFYVQTAKGWQRSAPISDFWGPTETLDTAHLHLAFRGLAIQEDTLPGGWSSWKGPPFPPSVTAAR